MIWFWNTDTSVCRDDAHRRYAATWHSWIQIHIYYIQIHTDSDSEAPTKESFEYSSNPPWKIMSNVYQRSRRTDVLKPLPERFAWMDRWWACGLSGRESKHNLGANGQARLSFGRRGHRFPYQWLMTTSWRRCPQMGSECQCSKIRHVGEWYIAYNKWCEAILQWRVYMITQLYCL